MYRDSSDAKVASAGIMVKTSGYWQAQGAVDRAEARLRHSTLVRNVAVGRAGLSSFPKPHYNKARGGEKRQLVQDEIQAEVEEERQTKMVGMYQQGTWTRWENVEECKITWSELWRAELLCIKSSNQRMIFSQAQSVCTAGAWRTIRHANHAKREAPWNTY